VTVLVPKGAIDEEVDREPALFYGSAREGMKDFLANSTATDQGILLPAFIGWSAREGSGVFDPVRQLDIKPKFYNLNPDLSVDLSSMEAELRASNVQAVVVIHYFGRSEPRLLEICELAHRHNALLVEDLAHGFFSAQSSPSAGKSGDVRLYSLHKMFPLAHGGLVTYAKPGLITGQEETEPELAAQLLSYNWASIGRKRIDNFTRIMEQLRRLPGYGRTFEPLWSRLAPGDVPQSLPVRVLDGVRDDIYHGMNSDGFGMVSLYHTLIEQVRGAFPELEALSRQIVNFPVHQDVPEGSIGPMVASFERHLSNRFTKPTDDSEQVQ
jgi:hypothetical protein